MDLHDRHNRPITCQGIGGIRPRTGSGARMRQGRGEAPRANPSERGGARKANRAFRPASPAERERPERQTERSVWLRQRNAKDPKGEPSVPPGSASGTRKRSPLPVQATKPFPHVRPAPPKEGPFDRGIWVYEGRHVAKRSQLWRKLPEIHCNKIASLKSFSGVLPGNAGPSRILARPYRMGLWELSRHPWEPLGNCSFPSRGGRGRCFKSSRSDQLFETNGSNWTQAWFFPSLDDPAPVEGHGS